VGDATLWAQKSSGLMARHKRDDHVIVSKKCSGRKVGVMMLSNSDCDLDTHHERQ
jgi:hypothetical protein